MKLIRSGKSRKVEEERVEEETLSIFGSAKGIKRRQRFVNDRPTIATTTAQWDLLLNQVDSEALVSRSTVLIGFGSVCSRLSTANVRFDSQYVLRRLRFHYNICSSTRTLINR